MNCVFYTEDGEIIEVRSGPNKDDLLIQADPELKYFFTENAATPFDNYVDTEEESLDKKVKSIPPRPSQSHEWDKKEKKWQSSNASLMKYVRQLRNQKLKDTDYTQVADIPFGQQKKDQWLQYRQKLRDLPSEFPNAYLIEHITWPDPPAD